MKTSYSSWAQGVHALVWQTKKIGHVLGTERKSEYCPCILEIIIWIMWEKNEKQKKGDCLKGSLVNPNDT